MQEDQILAEIHTYREELAKKFNYDIAAICRHLREEQERSGRKVVSLPPKRVRPGTAPVGTGKN